MRNLLLSAALLLTACSSAQSTPPAPAPGPALLYISATIHIESVPTNWPNPAALITFLQRATAAGLKFSVGADIGWLQGEPQAAEVVRQTAAMGVEWDVHAHAAADRARCAQIMLGWGVQPTGVVSGLIYSEIDALRSPQPLSGGGYWQPQVLWGIVTRAGHGPGADDKAPGLWRPHSSAQWTVHSPSANLVAVGGGERTLAAAEALANQLPSSGLLSTSLMVAPKTLSVLGGGDITQLEAFAQRMKALPQVRLATIAQTAQAWIAAGGVPSRP